MVSIQVKNIWFAHSENDLYIYYNKGDGNGGLMGPMVRVYGSLRDHLMRLQLMVGHM